MGNTCADEDNFNIIYKQKSWWKIIAKQDNRVIAAGSIVFTKREKLISFDNKIFFSVRENNIYSVLPNKDYIEQSFDNSILVYPYGKVYTMHSYIEYPEHFLVFRDFGMDELDTEIAPLVHILNKLGYATTGSCCGHGVERAWIDIAFKDINEVMTLRKKIKNSRFEIAQNKNIYDIANVLHLTLFALDIDETYSNISELVNILNT